MGLQTYHQKRNFGKTTEPRGIKKVSSSKLIFVVQKHNASRLHYDFRLELDGILLSWAVPKGPSLNPLEKHLAVQVEDHPYDYKDFEGVIAAGNYGAGEVIVWDNGTYHWEGTGTRKESETAMRKGLAKGHLEIVLEGNKLKGLFHLVRLKDKEWLLIKSKDKHASIKDILKQEHSVLTGKKVEDYKKAQSKKSAGTTKTKTSTSKKKVAADKIEPVAITKRISPMLAKLQEKIPTGKNLVFELKYDGYRAIASTGGDGNYVDLYSRNGLSLLEKFKVLKAELAAIPFAVVLDGEIVSEDDSGISKFQLLQQYVKLQQGTIRYYVFDLLFVNGEDIRELPFTERRKLLVELFKSFDSDLVRLVETRKSASKQFINNLKKKGHEGIIVKKTDAPYLSGLRTDAWVKIKNLAMQEAVIVGYTQPGGSRSWFGSILLATKVKGKLKYIGKCGTGFSSSTLKELYQRMQRYKVKKPALTIPSSEAKEAVFLKPALICEVRFTEFTAEGILRHPAFRGLREDKSLKDLNNEITIPEAGNPGDEIKQTPAKKKTTTIKRSAKKNNTKPQIEISNPDKIYWPKEKITKGMLVDYYREASDYILPFILNRLHSLHRHPNGINSSSFYQKNMNKASLPAGLETYTIKSGSEGKDVNYFLCNSKEALLYMANLGCIEINPWNNTVDAYDYPDWMIIDLDPEDIGFDAVVKTALEVRKLFEETGIESYVKTSGASGLHIYVPMGKKYTYDEVRMFAELIARNVNQRIPEFTSIVRAPAKRKKKVYIDYLQNRHGQTLAAPFSVRPKPGATVSMPLSWSEVTSKLSPSLFTMKNMMKRAEKAFELWKPVLGKAIPMKKVLLTLQEL